MTSASAVMDRALPGRLRIPDSRGMHVFFGIKHTALTLHVESFLIHIETLSSARDDKCIPIRISNSSSIHDFLVQNG